MADCDVWFECCHGTFANQANGLGESGMKNVCKDHEERDTRWRTIPPTAKPIHVDSCFGGAALYKYAHIDRGPRHRHCLGPWAGKTKVCGCC